MIRAASLIVGLWLGVVAPVQAANHGLLIGISDYSDTEFDSLDGPRNDVELVREVLLRRFGIPQANIRVLLDDAATHSALQHEFAALAKRVAPGDMVYIHFSGHGSYTKDRSGDERSGQDQTWVSHGSRRSTAGDDAEDLDAYDVLDDEIEGWLAAIMARTDYVVFVSDSCHSASVTRGEGPKTRAAPPDPRPHPNPVVVETDAALAARAVRIGAARDVQAAAEFRHEDGTHYGLFTWHWARALNEAQPGATWREVFQRAAVQVQQSRRGTQQPQMEGRSDLAVFGGDFAARPATVPVIRVRGSGQRVWLGAGALAGVTAGSQYVAVQAADGARRARLEITRVGPHDAEAVVVEGSVALGDLLVEHSHAYAFPPVGVFVVADTDDPASRETLRGLRRVVEDLPAYTLAASQAESEIVLRLLRPARSEAGELVYGHESDTLPAVDANAPAEVWVLTPFEELLAAGLRISLTDEDNALRLIGENLTKLARVREFKQLENAGAGAVMLPVEAVLMIAVTACPDGSTCRQLGDFGLREIRRMPVDELPASLPAGALLTFSIHNNLAGDYYVYLISAGPDGEIAAHFPFGDRRADTALLASGDTRDLFAIPRVIWLKNPGEEVVKLLVSRTPIDVSLLGQAGYVERSGGNPLERLLASAAHGTRSAGRVPTSTWGARSINIQVVPVGE